MLSTARADERQVDDALLWANPLDTAADVAAGEGQGELVTRTDGVTALTMTRDTTKDSMLRTFALPVAPLRGRRIYLSAKVGARDVSDKPVDWNGIKAMLKIDTTGETQWPQIALPTGTFDLAERSTRVTIPDDAQAITLFLGLERVSGTVWYDDLRVTAAAPPPEVQPVTSQQPIFRGHELPALRGVMAHPRISREDVQHLAEEWRGNVIRYQLLHFSGGPPRDGDYEADAYDTWLDGELSYLDKVLAWAGEYGVMVVIDLHSPPGGPVGGNGAVNAAGRFWTDPAAQRHFVRAWERITARYRGNHVIWGFDLLNEPDDRAVRPGCDDWQTLAQRAGEAVRSIDPERTLIVEPAMSGSAEGFTQFVPLALPRVVYSFHMYWPLTFTHQGVGGITEESGAIPYPGNIDGQDVDKAALERHMQPAVDFARRYRVHLYVGEFSAIRWAPGADRYLADVIACFEANGWDWSYHAYREWHGWDLERGDHRADESRTDTPSARQRTVLDTMQDNSMAPPRP